MSKEKDNQYDEKRKDNNFKTAFKEILNGDFSMGAKDSENKNSESDSIENRNLDNSVDSTTYVIDNFDADEESLIAKDMIISGNISSSSKIRILGEVRGNVSSKNDVIISGKVEGDISGNNISFQNSTVKGNIDAVKTISLNENSHLIGNIKSSELLCNGKVEGNINSKKLIELTSTANVLGDMVSQSIIIHENAVLKGMLDISSNENKNKL